METLVSMKQAICALFEVHADEKGVQRIVTPLEYSGSGDRVVVRVRPRNGGFQIDENGEAALYAGMNGGDVEAGAVGRWADEMENQSPVIFDDDEVLRAFTTDPRLVPAYLFRVVEAAQQLYAIATSRAERKPSEFKTLLSSVIKDIATSLEVPCSRDVELPIAGGLQADFVLGEQRPMILIAATSTARLLEAELIYLQYQAEHRPGMVVAVAESQKAVGPKQFERAAYYTDRTLAFEPRSLGQMIRSQVESQRLQ